MKAAKNIKSDIEGWSQLPIDMLNKIGTVTYESVSPDCYERVEGQ